MGPNLKANTSVCGVGAHSAEWYLRFAVIIVIELQFSAESRRIAAFSQVRGLPQNPESGEVHGPP